MNELKILKKLISFRTNEEKYDNQIKDFILELLKDVKKEIINIPNTKGRSFIIKIKGVNSCKEPITFLCHLDTVNPSVQWHSDPYQAVIKSGKITGLGACDVKGSITCLLKAILETKKRNRDVYLIFTTDEESTVKNIKKINQKIKIQKMLVIALEPFGSNIGIGQKGILEVEIIMPGRSAHASNATTPLNKKYNAIYKTFEIINFIKKQEASLAKEIDKNYGVSTVNLGKIEGGTAVNSMAEICRLQVSYRVIPRIKLDKIYKDLLTTVKKIDKKAKIKILLKGDSFDSIKKKETKKIAEIMSKYLGKVELIFGKVWSEVAELSKNGNTCLIIGAGNIEEAHRANEVINIDILEKFCDIYRKIIEDF